LTLVIVSRGINPRRAPRRVKLTDPVAQPRRQRSETELLIASIAIAGPNGHRHAGANATGAPQKSCQPNSGCGSCPPLHCLLRKSPGKWFCPVEDLVTLPALALAERNDAAAAQARLEG